MTQLLLASKSPRRRELLGQLGLPVEYVDIDVDETLTSPVAAEAVAETLARRKAAGYTERIGDGQVLVTADTVVVLEKRVLGKPRSRKEAAEMLQGLSGKAHQVYTGVCLRNDKELHSFTECTHVSFRQLEGSEIDYYIDSYRPYDKAGAYGIQEWIGMVGIEHIDGCYYNVMGLPIARLYMELAQFTKKGGRCV